MSMWRKTLVYLGLQEEFDEQDELPERFSGQVAGYQQVPNGEPEPVPVPAMPVDPQPTNVRPLGSRLSEAGQAHVRPMPAGVGGRVHVVAVSAFDEGAAEIARQYRMGTPVLFDMADADARTAQRILDFVSGVTFAVHGKMRKMGGRAFLIVPEGGELPLSERDRLEAMGYGRLKP